MSASPHLRIKKPTRSRKDKAACDFFAHSHVIARRVSLAIFLNAESKPVRYVASNCKECSFSPGKFSCSLLFTASISGNSFKRSNAKYAGSFSSNFDNTCSFQCFPRADYPLGETDCTASLQLFRISGPGAILAQICARTS